MTRFLYGSDIHTEWRGCVVPRLSDPETYDAVLLPGDIGSGSQGVTRLAKLIPSHKPILFLPGNHEYYGQNMDVLDHELAGLNIPNVTVMNKRALEFEGILIVGATLWSEIEPEQPPQDRARFDAYVRSSISDFSVIRREGRLFSVDDCRALNAEHRNFIDEELSKNDWERPVVVMTHFMPTGQATAPQFLGSPLNPYFASVCDDIMDRWVPDHWVFGHTHTPYEAVHRDSGTVLHCNPFGYPNENPSPSWKTFEVRND